MGTGVLSTKASSMLDGEIFSLLPAALANPFTLRDFYVQASVPGNSRAVELGQYLNVDEMSISTSAKESSRSSDVTEIHLRAITAILEVVTTNFHASFDYVRAPEPQGEVQEWWARMLSGSLNNPRSISDRPTIGESL